MTRTELDESKLHAFVGKLLGEFGGALTVPLGQIGERYGLFKTLKEYGPLTSEELAVKSGCAERNIREWLHAMAASEFIEYDPESRSFRLPPEHAEVLVNEDSPFFLMAAFDNAAAIIANADRIKDAFKAGDGVSWSDYSTCLSCSTARFFRPGYLNFLIQDWLPSMDDLVEKLKSGAKVADVGCGHGISTVIMAQAFPESEFFGFDFHPKSVEIATKHAEEHGLTNVNFQQSAATEYPGNDYDLVAFFDCLHDMGDPQGAAKHVLSTLKKDGTWMIIEPMAADSLEGNLNPIGRIYYAASTMVCVPTSLAQEVGTALGAQAGEKRLRDVINAGGFTRVRRARETPFNIILEARP